MAKQELTCDDILKELRAKQYRPIYYLMGEESYYIDLIADYITDNVLSETEKEFNLTVVYGADVDVATIINAAKRYPMMSEHQVVVVKEAQAVRNMEELSYYLQKCPAHDSGKNYNRTFGTCTHWYMSGPQRSVLYTS